MKILFFFCKIQIHLLQNYDSLSAKSRPTAWLERIHTVYKLLASVCAPAMFSSKNNRSCVCLRHALLGNSACLCVFDRFWYRSLDFTSFQRVCVCAPAGAFFSARSMSMEFWEHAISEYCQNWAVLIDFEPPSSWDFISFPRTTSWCLVFPTKSRRSLTKMRRSLTKLREV